MIQEIKRIPLEGLHNTRDLGGFVSGDGRRIKPHALIRSGELYGLTEKDKHILINEYKLRTIVDFRTETERREKPDPMLKGVAYIANPILDEGAIGITREKETDNNVLTMVLGQLKQDEKAGTAYMESLYANLLTNNYCKKQYARFFDLLLNQEEGAVLWHCTAGKDRAGMGTALLLSILDIPREQILADYMKVNEFAAENIRKTVQSMIEKTKDSTLADKIRILFSVQESYIGTVFQIIEEGYGTVGQYLMEEMQLNMDAVQSLRNKYLQ